jgi:hypothetical protein
LQHIIGFLYVLSVYYIQDKISYIQPFLDVSAYSFRLNSSDAYRHCMPEPIALSLFIIPEIKI